MLGRYDEYLSGRETSVCWRVYTNNQYEYVNTCSTITAADILARICTMSTLFDGDVYVDDGAVFALLKSVGAVRLSTADVVDELRNQGCKYAENQPHDLAIRVVNENENYVTEPLDIDVYNLLCDAATSQQWVKYSVHN